MHNGARDAAVEFGDGWRCMVPFFAPTIESVHPLDFGDGSNRNTCVTFSVPAVRANARGHLVVGRQVLDVEKIIRRASIAKTPLILWGEAFRDLRHPTTGLRLLVGDVVILGGAEAA